MMTENDVNNVSSISCATNISLFGGSQEPHLAELSAMRRAILDDRGELIHRYREIVKLDEDQQDYVADAYNADRRRWWKRVVDYVSLARGKFENGQIGEQHLIEGDRVR